MSLMKIVLSSDTRAVARLIDRRRTANGPIAQRVARIVEHVRRRGDAALLAYARRLDGLTGPIEVTRGELEASARQAPREVRVAIARAARHIRRVAFRQLPRPWRTTVVPGVRIAQQVTPLARVGCYVPGGRYPLPSTLLMTAVPAAVAGVGEVIVTCPRPDAAVLAAAFEAGVSRLFRVGGAHAIAALAYGTDTIPRVDKIVGPGNVYVAAAKARVAADCPIDFYAGPTEIVILSDEGPPGWIAADLIAQAEHDPDARALLLTTSRRLAGRVLVEIRRQLPAVGPAAVALRRNGGAIVTRSLREAVDLANRIAPEHLVCDRHAVARAVTRAGTVLVGPYAAPAAGDYATGSNHVLPTGGAARSRGGLSAADFVRVRTIQHLTRQGLDRLAPVILALARAEGLHGHAESVRVRLGRNEVRAGSRF